MDDLSGLAALHPVWVWEHSNIFTMETRFHGYCWRMNSEGRLRLFYSGIYMTS